MSGVGFFTDDPIATDRGTMLDYGASSGEAFRAQVVDAFDKSPVVQGGLLYRDYLRWQYGDALVEDSPLVDAATARAEVAKRGLDLKIGDEGIRRADLDAMQYLKQRETRAQVVGARSHGFAAVAGVAGGFAGSAVDPANIASAFLPVVGPARYALWLERAGTTGGRAAVRFGVGALEGMAGAAALEPVVYAGATREQLDYTAADSFINVAFGGVFGGGLHTLGGAFHDWLHMPVGDATAREAVTRAPDQVKMDLLQTALQQAERGEDVDVSGVIQAWHGSPHVFDAFDSSRIGTGEGAQAFGRGLYFAESEAVARGYRDKLSNGHAPSPLMQEYFTPGRIVPSHGGFDRVLSVDVNANGQWAATVEAVVKNGDEWVKDRAYPRPRQHSTAPTSAQMSQVLGRPVGALYQVNLKTTGEELLDWDKPLNEQPKSIRDALTKMHGMFDQEVGKYRTATGKDIVQRLGRDGAPDAVAAQLREAGIKGIQYLDGLSRDSGDGTRNFVVFDDRDVEIVSRNGQPVGQPSAPRPGNRLGRSPLDEQVSDRTEGAFLRQFVEEQGDPKPAAKGKKADRVQEVLTEADDLKAQVDVFREEGRMTAQDDARLAEAEDLGAWAETRAKAFEAAAACLEAG